MKKITAGWGTLFPTLSTPSSNFCRNVFDGSIASLTARVSFGSLIAWLLC
jgi:hypothetical protein